jgi:ATP-dependent Clp protease, protease subunit
MARKKQPTGTQKLSGVPEALYIKFFASVDGPSVAMLMEMADFAVKQHIQRLVILISSPGGSTFYALSAYNFLKGIPIEVETHNFGTVDSAGVLLFCAGSRRRAVPHARFFIHEVVSHIEGPVSLEVAQLEERLQDLRFEHASTAQVIATTTGRSPRSVVADMHARTMLSPEEAITYGLAHEIETVLIPAGASFLSIQPPPAADQQAQEQPLVAPDTKG